MTASWGLRRDDGGGSSARPAGVVLARSKGAGALEARVGGPYFFSPRYPILF